MLMFTSQRLPVGRFQIYCSRFPPPGYPTEGPSARPAQITHVFVVEDDEGTKAIVPLSGDPGVEDVRADFMRVGLTLSEAETALEGFEGIMPVGRVEDRLYQLRS